MTCPVCGEKSIPGLVCCDIAMTELDGDDVIVELVRGEVVVLHPGDVAVLQFERVMSAADADAVRQLWQREAPGTRLVILAAGARLGAVIRGGDD